MSFRTRLGKVDRQIDRYVGDVCCRSSYGVCELYVRSIRVLDSRHFRENSKDRRVNHLSSQLASQFMSQSIPVLFDLLPLRLQLHSQLAGSGLASLVVCAMFFAVDYIVGGWSRDREKKGFGGNGQDRWCRCCLSVSQLTAASSGGGQFEHIVRRPMLAVYGCMPNYLLRHYRVNKRKAYSTT